MLKNNFGWVQKNFGLKKLGSKKVCVQTNFGSKKCFGFNKSLGAKNFRSKNVDPKNYGFKKNLSKKCFVLKNILC